MCQQMITFQLFRKCVATPGDVQHLINKAHDETKLQCHIDDAVIKKVRHFFKDVHEKALTSTYTEHYQVIEQATAKEIYLGRADYQNNNNIGMLVAF